ncbi:MAG: 50S ribosomal protein L10 [Candidatus Sungbacteria bacterium RIFCSPLOWO2_02_FULL_54_10]|uniref:Large ribosomal subunit protein uL10 n=1 Tax=Candidatus Sungbacteria bacterium RIFCSPHIGHO2_02_FULL_53_17 TaxID=1802275 RepID=A0A1G2KWQ6_9BACT|nr:MAG: 50S ribosomal protein L10 [Candidatus Sungbacteria bacterium RIFCSPHIGHO2_02_FULL_53_17]OHA12325.1 MAG: 50S ribosomal protein L10 [Candidatus Sungbacteria bacterium RIFCSPLOWO2_02_FULL_54_10]
MLTKAKKADVVAGLMDQFSRQKVAIFSDFHGVSVAKATRLRRTLKKENAEYKVAKKTLLARALSAAGITFDTTQLKGEIGVAFGYGDQAAPAKVLAKFSRENETFRILGGLLGSLVMSGKDVIALAQLPSREVLLAQVAAALSGPMRGLAGALQGNIRKLAFILGQIRDKKQ